MSSTKCEALHALFKEDWDWEMNDNPEYASQAGFRTTTSGHALQDVSVAGYMKRKAHSEEMLRRIAAIDFTLFDSNDARMFAPLFIQMHRDVIDGIDHCPLYYMPINSMQSGGVLYSFLESIDWMPFENASDYEAYLARLQSAPAQFQQFIAVMREGIAAGVVASTAMCRNVEAQLESIIESGFPELRAPLNTPLGKQLVTDPTKLAQFETAIGSIKTAFESFLDFFHDEYAPKMTFNPACSALPNGAVIYEACLKYHTTGSWTPAEIHALGLSEVARLEARYRADVLLPLGYKESEFNQFVEFVRTDPQFYVKTSEELLDHYKSTCARISTIMPNFFNEIPTSPLEILKKDGGPAAFYIAGTADGKRPGRFYVNCSEIEKRPLYESIALALHEANPGHHHQAAVNMEDATLPDFMRVFEDRRYEVGGARRNMCTAYMEGWGLYSEFLGEEMGLYTSPYELFGRLSMEMMRAVRLVVDTGIHAMGWSLEQAIVYMMEKTGMHRHECDCEVFRYATWPGQATAYKIGELSILKQRRKAEAALGHKFNVKDFHTAVLRYGPVPMNLLENLVQHYINAVGPVEEGGDAGAAGGGSCEGSGDGCPVLHRDGQMYGQTVGKVDAYPMAAAAAAAAAGTCPHAQKEKAVGGANQCPVAVAGTEKEHCSRSADPA